MTTVVPTKIVTTASSDNVLDERDLKAIALRNALLSKDEDGNLTVGTVDLFMRSLEKFGAYTTDVNGDPCITLSSLAESLHELFDNNVSGLSDGNHTFDELYDHRCTLFCCVLSLVTKSEKLPREVKSVWYARKHSDGTMFDGYIIAGMSTIYGDCTYHLKQKPYYTLLKRINAVEYSASPQWDGHNSKDVLDRLVQTFLSTPTL